MSNSDPFDSFSSVPFSQVVAALLDETNPFPITYLDRFSDITPADLQPLSAVWTNINPARRISLLESLEDLAEVDSLVSFNEIGRMALTDPEPDARAAALGLLCGCANPSLAPEFIHLLETDDNLGVKVAAATALAQFVYMGELKEIPEETLHRVEDTLLKVVNSGTDPCLRRQALEALGYSCNEEVPPLIQQAYDSGDNEWVASALFAMGRSLDPDWEKHILANVDSRDTDVQLEAVRAAGHLELASSRKSLLDLLDELETIDEDVRAAVIWSLSQIGGELVKDALEDLLEKTEDQDEASLIEDALDNLEFTEGFPGLELFNSGLDDELDTELDLDLEDGDEADENNPRPKS